MNTELTYQRIITVDDPDIPYLTSILRLPGISRYLSIDEERYWSYVADTENVHYFKVYHGERLVGAIHCETDGMTLYMDIMVIPAYQRTGIGTAVLGDLLGGRLPLCFDAVEVSVDEQNTASIRLFEKMGFVRVSQEEELIGYRYTVHGAQN